MSKYSPVQQFFIILFSILIAYEIISHLPFLPSDILGYSTKKILKALSGIAFSISGILIYLKAKI